MELGRWDKAIIKSILSTFIPVITITGYFFVVESNNNTDFIYYLFSMVAVLAIYFVVSVIGWCVIGIPVHWLASRYFNQNLWCYCVALVLFVLFITNFSGMSSAAFYGSVAILQTSLFLFFLHKLKT